MILKQPTAIRSIIRLSWRHAWRRPLQSFFLIAGVAIGVAMIVAIDLANGSAQRAFELGAESVAGRATHEIVGGPSGLDEQIYTELRTKLGYRLSAPVVESYVAVRELDGQPMRLLGVDPLAEAPFRSYLGVGGSNRNEPDFLSTLMVQSNTVLMSTDVAAHYHLAPGDVLTAQIGSRTAKLKIAGLLAPSDDLSRRALESLLITDIASAQEVLGKVGRLDRIDLIIPSDPGGQAVLAHIEAILPAGARITISSARGGAVNEMTAAFRLNLTALSLLALVVGMFLIYNTVTFSVVQQRPVIGSLRALGLTRREIFASILAEAACLGMIGTLFGLGLGVLLGRGAVQLVTQTINDLFFVVSVREINVPLLTLAKGGLIGVCAAVAGAAIPAYEATSVPPAGALQRSNVEERTIAALPLVSAAGVGCLIAGTILLIPNWNLVITFIGLFAIIIGSALLAPLLTLGIVRGLQRLIQGWAGIMVRMAPRYIVRSLSRTSVAIAALMVAVSVIIGVGVMIGSFRATVELWLNDVLQADIFVSPPTLGANQSMATLDTGTVNRLEHFDGIARAATTRRVDLAAFFGHSSGGPVASNAETVQLVAMSQDLAGPDRHYRSAVGDWRQTWHAVEAGYVLINEPMSRRYHLKVGDQLVLQTDQGRHSFPIAGVVVDFNVDSVVFMHAPIYRRWWNDQAVSAVALFVKPGVEVDREVEGIRAAFGGQSDLLIRSNRGMRQDALAVFDRTFSITVALQLLATLVAFIGILSTLMSLQLERMREIGVLRSTGVTRFQLWRLSLMETGLIGAIAGVLAIPTGLVLAIILIYIINLRSFGWTLAMQLQPQEFLRAFGVALGAALLAGIYPAWRMGNIQPATALRSE